MLWPLNLSMRPLIVLVDNLQGSSLAPTSVEDCEPLHASQHRCITMGASEIPNSDNVPPQGLPAATFAYPASSLFY